MVLKDIKKWIWIFFLVPVLLAGDHSRRAETGSSTQQEESAEESFPSILFLDEPLPGSLWLLAENIAFEHGLSPKLIKSIILTESNGDPQKVSARGAKGLMQLMPVVVQRYKVLDPLDPVANIRGGVQYLRALLEEFSGDLHLALAAYNAGPGAVRKYRGIPPFPETEAFVRKVTGLFHSEGADSAGPPPRLPRMAQKDAGEGSRPISWSAGPQEPGLVRETDTAEAAVQDQ